MQNERKPERMETVVIGGGQAGLSVGYHLQRWGLPFVILDANERVGDAWRKRWDSLRLFTPARFDGLDGMRNPLPKHSAPTKDEMGDYLESYAKHFELPVRSGVRVERLSREGDTYLVEAGEQSIEADRVVVAMSSYQEPKLPAFASELDAGIVQMHASEYRNPSQLREGGVLVVGAGNSGAEIAIELVRSHPVWMSGRSTGALPFRLDGWFGRHFGARLVGRVLFHRVLTVKTPIGRKMRPKLMSKGTPLIRVKPRDLAAAGVQRVPRTEGVRDGKPVLEDGRVLDVTNVIWCTGYHPGFSWIDLPVLGEREPMHELGVASGEPGLYFVGLEFLYSVSSEQIHGVGRDAKRIAKVITERAEAAESARKRAPAAAASVGG
ncbi:MAG: FAD-dependent oxidoreductase [Dehalococcoidia bacterium]|nr:FAD-dependent oxidoreductase [Dehalococcoidia bacterium]